MHYAIYTMLEYKYCDLLLCSLLVTQVVVWPVIACTREVIDT